jgi:hypothetical protein
LEDFLVDLLLTLGLIPRVTLYLFFGGGGGGGGSGGEKFGWKIGYRIPAARAELLVLRILFFCDEGVSGEIGDSVVIILGVGVAANSPPLIFVAKVLPRRAGEGSGFPLFTLGVSFFIDWEREGSVDPIIL